MNNRLKIFLLLFATLTIGIIIGFLVSGRVISHRIEKMNNYYSQTGFGKEIMRVIKPTDEQRDIIVPIFRKYADKNQALMGDYRTNQRELFIELRKELNEYLDDDQLQRLNNHWENRKRKFNRGESQHKKRKGKGRIGL